ncbi:MAG: KpsF/GutQ family sugar-phosphate isomerase [Lautropia sp.]|nr:KpsF/GutQ family sugar-phosphate isomerase [Lautropia sp.]
MNTHALPPSATEISDERLIERARQVLSTEADAILHLSHTIDHRFGEACRLILACQGRVIVSGMGKSGHVARKIAATLASTGTPAFFVHPGEASHGDLGMVTPQDVFVALSNSGRTDELLTIVPQVKRQGAGLIAMTGDPESPLAGYADIHLYAGALKEACPLNLAPTASTTAALALGDALAVALLEARGFGSEDFARSHPGGSLGRKLLTHVGDIMRSGGELPTCRPDALFTDALLEISHKRMGMVAVLDGQGRIAGIFTDGDLRRVFGRKQLDLMHLTIGEVMTPDPIHIAPEALAVEAVRIMESRRISQILVADAGRHLVGALHFHDLLTAKVV